MLDFASCSRCRQKPELHYFLNQELDMTNSSDESVTVKAVAEGLD